MNLCAGGPVARPQPTYETKDGSRIQELWHPDHHGGGAMSLAQATVDAGAATRLHRHMRSEEIYHVVSGAGMMECGLERFAIKAGDTIRIPAGVAHRVVASVSAALVILCCCVPPYRHDDTQVL
ncbi:cupin domain-containing protein [Acidiferrobacter thiooxydans]|uniref:Cupin domain-containing protein n=1 Tax=Acidiferrobacter thiooxydans TaxID=163359 RepID=A0A1C2G2T8_9GAMM|nr:cupin domain-containing protein [Acidiferrobacter thiooxydans]RCN59398.1 cupin domain-containing protein [Acidiferrobacter thiooxydans]